MRFDLADLYRRARNPRRRVIPFRAIQPPATFATNLHLAVYAPIIEQWEVILPRLRDDYARSLSDMTTDSPASLRIAIEQAEGRATSTTVSVRAALGRWAATVEGWHRKRWKGAVLTATSVNLETMIGPQDVRQTLEAVIERNVALVSSVSDETRRRIADAVFRGLTERLPADEIARQMREAIAMARRRARNIAADQLVKVSASLNEERRRQAGIMAWEWVHSGKVHLREEHEARNGFLYSDDSAQQGETYEGRKVRKPPKDRPGQLPFCGCTTRAVLIL